MSDEVKVLDQGYIKVIEHWGSDERIIEAARMSTNKGFLGWGPKHASSCSNQNVLIEGHENQGLPCGVCGEGVAGDEKLLKYLYTHGHMTPFEMAGCIIEVKAPIFVFREWHRHRTQSYNELSARYTPLPSDDYVPDFNNLVDRAITARESSNKQAGALDAKGSPIDVGDLHGWWDSLQQFYSVAEDIYQAGLLLGVPKELARLPVPVARYSRMRASANLRNWLGFLTLRNDQAAQWEIRQYAIALTDMLAEKFPRTLTLWQEKKHGS